MNKYAKLLFLLVGVITVSQAVAQHGCYRGRYNDRYYFSSRTYRYAPLRTSVSIIARLPFGAVNLGGRPYHYYDGVY